MKDRLEVTTPTDRQIVMKRSFDAPRQLVFEAFTTPALLQRWLLGPPGWSMVVCEVDLRAGGAYRYVWRHDADGEQMGMGGVYTEIQAPEGIVSTVRFDDPWYRGEAVDTLVLTEERGQTKLTQTVLYESREVRDGVAKSGMEGGVAASYDRLQDILSPKSADRS